MALIGLFIGLFVVEGAIVLCAAFGAEWAEDRLDNGIAAAIICTLILAPIIGITLGCQYSSALSLEARIPMLAQTIEEQKELLGDCDQTLGSGLEGLEIKQTIQETIRDRNDLIASAQIRRRSGWYLFKPEVVW